VAYRVEFAPAADRQFRKLPAVAQKRLEPEIDALADDPRPPGFKKLKGMENLYRIQVGDYRVVYQIRDDALLVLVVRVRHRKDVYRF